METLPPPPLEHDSASPENAGEILPLSFAQQRLWFLDQLHPKSPLYNVPWALRLRGTLDPEALEKSLRFIIARHEVLRSVYVSNAGEPAQRVLDQFTFKLPVRPVTGPELEARLAEEARRPFDLGGDLMLRAVLFRLEPSEHVLFLNAHHIAFDEWSQEILMRELAAGYQAFCAGRVPEFPELPIQYADFALWQKEATRQNRWARDLEYWKERLAGEWPPVAFPSIQRSVPEPGEAGERAHALLGKDLAVALRALARMENVTIHHLLLAAFQTLLYRYGGQEDIVVGTPVAGRERFQTEPLIGFFVNTLAMRVSFAGRPSFREVLARVRQASVEAFSHQEVPFDQIVEAVRPQRDGRRNPLFNAVFSTQSGGEEEGSWGTIQWSALETHSGTAKFDVTFVVAERKEDLQATLEYNVDVLNAPAARRMLRHFQVLLEGIVRHPDEKAAVLPLLDDAERLQIVEEWNRTTTNYPREQTVHALFEAQAARTPAATAVVYGAEKISYRELERRANQWAHYLRTWGVGEGTPVGVLMDRSVEMIIAWLAVLKSGGVYVPLDPDYPAERLAFMVQDTKMPVILAKSRLTKNLPQGVARVVQMDEDRKSAAAQPETAPMGDITPDALAYIIYTSGSTGVPKGVEVPHRGITRLVFETNYIELNEADRIAQLSNSSFDAATFEVWGALLRGGQLIGVPRDTALSPGEFARFLEEEKISALFLTTALFNQMAAEVPAGFRSVKAVLTGGEAGDPKAFQRVLQCGPPARLLHVYGPTECTTFATWLEVKEVADHAAAVPIGRPISNTSCYILDSEGRPAPAGIAGELHLGGDGLARGYHNRPELTAAKFVPNPFASRAGERLYKTGDLARFLPDGQIEFIGRLDHQVKIRGFRVEPGEIEAALRQAPGVQEALVIVDTPPQGGKRLVAYITRAPARAPLAPEARRFLKEKLPDYMTPSALVELDAFPLTPNGKIDRRALPSPAAASAAPAATAAPLTMLQSRLRAIWEEVLGHKAFGVTDNFFESGGHSLLAVKLMAKVEQATGRKLPVSILFQAPTIEKLAEWIGKEHTSATGACLVEIQPQGKRRPIFWLHTLGGGGGGGLFTYRKLANYLGPDQPSYGFVAPIEPLTSLEAMAARYIADMRAVQPSGPYQLGGYCFGGVVAFEMARQLEEQGETVSLLALLDSSPPDPERKMTSPGPALALHFVKTAPRYLMRALLEGKLWRHFAQVLKGQRQPRLDDLVDMTHYPANYKNYARVHWGALVKYIPRPIRSRAVLFKTRECHPLRLESNTRWRVLAPNQLQVRHLPGKHEDVLEEPSVQAVAAQLGELLDQSI